MQNQIEVPSSRLNVRAIRRKQDLNQHDFWLRLGVTQSGGSRYESGRRIPRPVQTLINVVYVHAIDLEKINPRNARLIRAVLDGEIDAEQLMKTAELCQQLKDNAAEVGMAAVAVAGQVRALGGLEGGEV